MKNPAAVALGRLGGKVTSKAKTRAVRANAKLGGWPKGKPRKPKRAIWTRQGVPADRQNAMLADTSEKATPEFMAQFFPVKN
jgi:hypothetical protein